MLARNIRAGMKPVARVAAPEVPGTTNQPSPPAGVVVVGAVVVAEVVVVVVMSLAVVDVPL